MLFSNQLNNLYMNFGFSLNPYGLEMGIFHIPRKGLFLLIGGYGWINGWRFRYRWCRDYTETLGTTNAWFDGQFSMTHLTLVYIFIVQWKNILTQLGLIPDKSFNKYYDL